MKLKKELNIIGKRKIFFTLSSIIILAAIVASFIFGVKLDIQFTGGSISTYSYSGDIDINKFTNTSKEIIGKEIKIQEASDIATDKKNITISVNGNESVLSETQTKLTEQLKKDFPDNDVVLENSSNVDPSIGKEFFAKSLVAVLFAAIVMIIYIAFRFKRIGGLSAGVVSVIALIHDLIVVYAVFVILQIPLNDSFIAVMLTILGYSINDTIVIYDRVRENRKLHSELDVGTLVNKSINQSLKRSINTTVSTVLAMAIVCIVSVIFGVTSILNFALPLIIGMISGVYSTICIAGPLWVIWQNKIQEKDNLNKGRVKKLSKI